jgi:hypothetical protein
MKFTTIFLASGLALSTSATFAAGGGGGGGGGAGGGGTGGGAPGASTGAATGPSAGSPSGGRSALLAPAGNATQGSPDANAANREVDRRIKSICRGC